MSGSFASRAWAEAMIDSLSCSRTQITKGKPKRSRYAAFARVNTSCSSGVSRSRPAEPCSRALSAVILPSIAALPARSGWARISATRRSSGAVRIASVSADNSSSRLENGPRSYAASATQGECSKSPP